MGRVTIDPLKFDYIVETSEKLNLYVRAKAIEINSKAAMFFLVSNDPFNEWRISETTPPKYINSFRVRKLQIARECVWRAENTDPGAIMVEYGAHAGGRTPVLDYAPYRKALATYGGVTE